MAVETGEIRHYRVLTKAQDGLVLFRITYKETDLAVLAERDLTLETLELVRKNRNVLEEYIQRHPEFLTALKPLPLDPQAPSLARQMLAAAKRCGVGPMAAVAGALAEAVGREILAQGWSSQIAIENGGDVFLALKRPARVALYAGDSPLSGRLALKIPEHLMPCGVCTSSGKLGHSLSLGKAQAVCVVAKDTALADAAATALGNLVKGKRSLPKVLSLARQWPLLGVVCIAEDDLGVYGPELQLLAL